LKRSGKVISEILFFEFCVIFCCEWNVIESCAVSLQICVALLVTLLQNYCGQTCMKKRQVMVVPLIC